jgi:pimeloyl-ACP methyl ester carboxylesterase
MSLNRITKLLALLLVLFLVVGFFLVEGMLPYAGIKPMRRGPEAFEKRFPKGMNPENYGLRTRKIKIQTPDSLALSALLVQSNTDTSYATVVLLHGISGCKETQFERAQVLAEAGYSSLLLDLRAHGQSEGEYCTFGYHEKNDLRVVADTLNRIFPNRPLAVWGASLGGAVTLQAMSVEPRYQFGIVESTFDEFEKVAMEYGSDWLFGLRSHWLTRRVLQKSGEIAHFKPDSVKPVQAAATIQRPVLFIHGDKDSRIPMWFGERNYEACPSPDKVWVKVHGGGHNNLWRMAGDTMQQAVLRFLDTTR